MSGPSLVGFLAPDTHNECPKKAARGKEMPEYPTFTMKVNPSTRRFTPVLPFLEVRHA